MASAALSDCTVPQDIETYNGHISVDHAKHFSAAEMTKLPPTCAAW
jgi:hypothetical protein